MFGDLSSPLVDLDEETRARLADLLSKRNEYIAAQTQLNTLRINLLRSPSPAGQEVVDSFSSTVVAPLRDAMNDDTVFLASKAINIDGLKSMLPMIAMVMVQNMNIGLLLATLGIEPDVVNKFTELVNEFIKSDM